MNAQSMKHSTYLRTIYVTHSIFFPTSLTVTVASSPSGTLATMIPMRKITASSHVYSRMSERMKKVTPRNTATPVMRWIKCSISVAIGVFPPSSPEARLAIRPITVRSPVLMTMPRAVPRRETGFRKQKPFPKHTKQFVQPVLEFSKLYPRQCR